MYLSWRMVITSRPTTTRSIWLQVRTQYLYDIVDLLVTSNILSELIIDFDQTPSKYVPTENVTIAEKNSKNVARKGDSDKGE